MPGPRAIGGRILTDVYDEEWGKFAASVEGRHLTMSMDGWSNLTNNPVLAICLDNQLVYSVDTTGKPHTWEYLRLTMMDALAKVQVSPLNRSRKLAPLFIVDPKKREHPVQLFCLLPGLACRHLPPTPGTPIRSFQPLNVELSLQVAVSLHQPGGPFAWRLASMRLLIRPPIARRLGNANVGLTKCISAQNSGCSTKLKALFVAYTKRPN